MFNRNFIILAIGIFCILNYCPISVSSENTCQNVQEGRVCGVCRRLMSQLITLYKTTHSVSAVKTEAKVLCTQFKLSTPRVCEGFVNLNADIFVYIIDRRPNLTSEVICGLLLQDQYCKYKKTKDLDWTIEIKEKNAKQSSPNCPSRKTKTCVQITDPHLDLNYRTGAESECTEPTCCRFDQEADANKTDSVPAGPWGSYNCDTPLNFFKWTLNHISNSISNIDCIYYNGDGIHHGSWATTFQEVTNTFTTINRLLKSTFPGVPIFPIFGNHDQHPMNMFTPTYLDINNDNISTTRQLYQIAASDWRPLIGDSHPEIYDTIRDEGYYTIPISDKLRVVALNNNAAFSYNFWLLYDSSYLRKQLLWLHQTLLEAEKKSEYVHILLHVPSNDPNCFPTWAREYWRIIERFKDTVTAQFTGHSHRDQFNLFYSRKDPKSPISIAWNGGSVTTYQKVNPNYKVFTFDDCTGEILRIDTYVSDIGKAGSDANKSPSYYLEYTLPQDYGMANLGVQELNELVSNKFRHDQKLLEKYCKYYIKNANTALEKDCSNTTILDMLITEITDTEPCSGAT